MTNPSLLDKVRTKLRPLKGAALFDIADHTRISYDSLLRIRDGRNDPGFSLVQKLAEHFRIVRSGS
jgi:hypothetical protein